MGTFDEAQKSVGRLKRVVVTGDTQMEPNTLYIANSGSLITFTLPSDIKAGQEVAVAGFGSGGWKVMQNGGQTINNPSGSATPGMGAGFQSANQYDVLHILCAVDNTDFICSTQVGSPTTFAPSGPFFVASSIGGMPAVKFNNNEAMQITNNPSLFGVHISIFAVWKVTTTNGATWMIEKNAGGGDTGSWLFGANIGDSNKISFFDTSNSTQVDGTPISDGVGFLESLIHDGSNNFFRRNGSVDASPGSGGDLVDNGGDIYLGHMANFGGDSNFFFELAEFLHYNVAVNNTDRDNIEGYLLNKYGLGAGSPFNPTTVSGLQIWLKADTLGLSDGNPVASWNDSSGNGNNAVTI